MRVLDPIILSLAAVATALPASGLPIGTNAARDAYDGSLAIAKRPNPVDLAVVDGGRVVDPQPFTMVSDQKSSRIDGLMWSPKEYCKNADWDSRCKTPEMQEALKKDKNDKNANL